MNGSAPDSARQFWQALGPGLLFAGAAVGVSHLVQSTRAGAGFGLALLGVVILANIFKYPAFSFGPRYAAATGTSLLEGYRRQGRWTLILFTILSIGTMFTVQAAVTFVTAALGTQLLGWTAPDPIFGFPSTLAMAALLTLLCAGLLVIGQYRWLDRIIKVVVVALTLTTLLSAALLLPQLDYGTVRILPSAEMMADKATVLAIVALVGWMPSAFDISIWSSLWTLEKHKQHPGNADLRSTMLDFKIGYLGTALLALCFLVLGAGVMHGSGESFSSTPHVFAGQIIDLYARSLGEWSRPVVIIAAFTVMFSTTLTVVDGWPRALSTLYARFRTPEAVHGDTARIPYWIALLVMAWGSLTVIRFFLGSLSTMVDVATVLSFMTAPALAFFNHRAIFGSEVPTQHRPGTAMRLYSIAGIVFSLGLALYFVWRRWLS
jgi:Mn2+/Fe2+ NRAMP family transporter